MYFRAVGSLHVFISLNGAVCWDKNTRTEQFFFFHDAVNHASLTPTRRMEGGSVVANVDASTGRGSRDGRSDFYVLTEWDGYQF